jgi:hypothetical protein
LTSIAVGYRITTRRRPATTEDTKAARDSGLTAHCLGVTVSGEGVYIKTGPVVPHRKRNCGTVIRVLGKTEGILSQ